jgi:DNA-binding GntR family transcriptional regulator
MMPRPSLHVYVANALREEIERGVAAPGDRLVEMQVARRFGVSQAPVREALRMLEREGLVDHRPRRGVYVRPITAVDIEEIYSLRVAIEGLSARRAVQRMTSDDRALMWGALDAMRSSAGHEQSDFVDASLAVHEAIALTARHARLYSVWRTIASHTRRFAHLQGRFDDLDADVVGHRALLETFDKGDPDLAEAAMKEHVTTAGQALLRFAADAGLLEQGTGEGAASFDEWATLLRGQVERPLGWPAGGEL